MNFASSRREWPMTGFISIAVTSLNRIAQLAVVFKCKPAKRTFALSFFWLPQYYVGPLSRSQVFGFTMLLVVSFGSDAFFEQLPWAAGWNTFQNQKIPPATHSTVTRLFCSGSWEIENVVAYRGLNLLRDHPNRAQTKRPRWPEIV